jgi:hypothetical protein
VGGSPKGMVAGKIRRLGIAPQRKPVPSPIASPITSIQSAVRARTPRLGSPDGRHATARRVVRSPEVQIGTLPASE